MPVPIEYKEKAIEVTTALLEEHSSYAALARFLAIGDNTLNPSHPWQAIEQDYVSPKLVHHLAAHGLMEKPPPKDPRARVWMRTDNAVLACQQMLAHYSVDDVAAGMLATLSNERAKHLAVRIGDFCE